MTEALRQAADAMTTEERVLALWRAGHDTLDIALALRLGEAQVYAVTSARPPYGHAGDKVLAAGLSRRPGQ